MKKYLKDTDAAEYLGVSVSTIRGWRYSGTGPNFLKPETGLVRYTVEDLDNFMASIPKTGATKGAVQNANQDTDRA